MSENHRGRSGRVLIAEDDPKLAALLARSLGEQGYCAHVAATGRYALELAEKFEFDAAVLDVGLRDIDGFDLCSYLRERGSRANVVIISAYWSSDYHRRGRRAGADDFLLKPFGLAELSRRLAAHR